MKQAISNKSRSAKLFLFLFAIFLSAASTSQEIITKENLKDYKSEWFYMVLNEKEDMPEHYFLINKILINGSKIVFDDKILTVLDAVYLMQHDENYFILKSPSSIYYLESDKILADEGVLTVYKPGAEFNDYLDKYEFRKLEFMFKNGKSTWKANEIQKNMNN